MSARTRHPRGGRPATAILGPLPPAYGGSEVGGVAVHTERLALHLARNGTPVSVMADSVAGMPGEARPAAWGAVFGVRGAPAGRLASALAAHPLRAAGVSARVLTDPRRSMLGLPLSRVVSRGMLLSLAAAAAGPGVLHVQQADFRPLYARWAGLDRLPSVITVHGLGLLRAPGSEDLRATVADNLLSASIVTCPSEFLAEEIRSLGVHGDGIRVIPNGVDHSAFRPLERASCRRELGLAPDAPLALFLGRVTEAKGAEDLLAAVRAARERGLDLRVALVGPMALASPPEEAVASVPRRIPADAVVLHRADAPPDELPLWIGAADIVVVPSHYEGFGLSALEAMACARPVVATEVGGLPEVVPSSAGIRVPPEDPGAIAEAIVGLLGSAQRRREMGAAGVREAQRYTWDAVANAFAAVYEEVAAGRVRA